MMTEDSVRKYLSHMRIIRDDGPYCQCLTCDRGKLATIAMITALELVLGECDGADQAIENAAAQACKIKAKVRT